MDAAPATLADSLLDDLDDLDVVEDAGAKGRLRERGHGVKHVRAGAQCHLFQRGGLLALAQVAPLTVATGLAGKRSAARARRSVARRTSHASSVHLRGAERPEARGARRQARSRGAPCTAAPTQILLTARIYVCM